MSRFGYSALVFTAVISVFFAVSIVGAKSTNSTRLNVDQKIIIDKKINDNTKNIGNSGYYLASVKDIESSNVVINPILKYRTNMIVDDPYEPQDYLVLLDVETFWDNMPDSSGIVVANIDGGVVLDHEDLNGRLAINELEFGVTETEGPEPNCTSRTLAIDKSCNNIDDDINGYVDDWRGWDFAQSDNDPRAGTLNPSSVAVGHGSETAGLIGMAGNNAIGAASINWQSKILPIQIFTDNGEATTIELAEGIDYAIQQGVDVINLSLGTENSDPTIDTLLQQAYDAGIIVIVSAGNCGGADYLMNGCSYEGQLMYPASSSYAISVGASDLVDDQAIFSSRGPDLDLLAPGNGDSISVTYALANETSAYATGLFGTSFASPIVSGLAAVLKAEWSAATVNDIRSLLVDSALKTPSMTS